jgi:hypothetical protein
MELISYAEETAELLEKRQQGESVHLDGARINELYGTISVFDKWRNHPAWPHLVRSLATEAEGPHSLMLLTAASYLNAAGNGVGIVFKDTGGRIADLLVQPDLTQRVSIEIKTPQMFRNVWPSQISLPDAETVITRHVNEVASPKRGQFGGGSGILAIGTFHLPTGGLDQLTKITGNILEWQAKNGRKPSLVGVLLCEFGFTMRTANGNASSPGLSSTLINRWVPHRGYRGKMRIEEGFPRLRPAFPSNAPENR